LKPEVLFGAALMERLIKEESVMKNNHLKSAITALALAGVVGLSGCATTSDLDQLRSEVEAAQATADRAEAKADAAASDASAALATANDAKATADATEEKVDRMFKKAMYK
jgi:murein lipoprotein